MKEINLKSNLCVVGGGLAGLCAAIAAARRGVKVILVHDRAVLGGNASSEVRMWVCGAASQNPFMRETGIIEELLLDNLKYNSQGNLSLWDTILYGKTIYQENLTTLLNCACFELKKSDDRIHKIRCFQSNAQTFYNIEADYFADCSGDSILGVLSGAKLDRGREASSEFDESIQPKERDNYTMGASCLIQVRETTQANKFTPPTWANKYYHIDDLPPHRSYGLHHNQNFWYLETGGTDDSIYNIDQHREKLLRMALGVWDYIKNYSSDKEQYTNFELEWLGFLPGKRESYRFVGDYVMSQNDISAGGNFADTVAFGGWTMDDHHPEGFDYQGEPTIFHPAPSPFSISYKSLYSSNIANLFCAGRNISVTHAALSATRVMATCATIGQAVGYACSIAVQKNCTPREVNNYINDLQQILLFNDCYLPGIARDISPLSKIATISASNDKCPLKLIDGVDRASEENSHAWSCQAGDYVTFSFNDIQTIKYCRIIFDSNLTRGGQNFVAVKYLATPTFDVPETLVKDLTIEFLDKNNNWSIAYKLKDNHQRLLSVPLLLHTRAVRFVINSTYSKTNKSINLFSIDLF